MTGKPRRLTAVLLASMLLLALAAPSAMASMRLVGSVGVKGYGYEDAVDTNHVWLMQTTRLSLYTDSDFSLHFSGGWLGDSGDDFSNSSVGRFTKGYLEYGRLGSQLHARAGRFFLYRGVALGVIDGIDLNYKLNRNLGFSLFGGLMGPLTRRFEFEDPATAMSYGAMVSFKPSDCKIADEGRFALSYVAQQRDEQLFRHRIGLQTQNRWDMGLRWANVVELRLTENLFRKWVSRASYHTGPWRISADYGLLMPDVSDASWFADFSSLPARSRIGANVMRSFGEEREWGAGLGAQTLLTSGAMGLRGGPIVLTPWGQAGYRFSAGDRALSNGPWAHLRLHPAEGVELFAYGAMVSYEWDAFDIQQEELTSLSAGLRYTPTFFEKVTASAEFQVYQTPIYDMDRRALGGLVWRFDTGRSH